MRKTHFAAIVEPHKAQTFEGEIGDIGPEELLIKMQICNICTNDYQQWLGLRNHQGFPMAGGHEWSGIILEKGSKVIDDFQVGDQVGMGIAGCGCCDNCRRGIQSDCTTLAKNKGGMTVMVNGFYGQHGFVDYKIINQREVYKISNDISPVEAGFLEPVSTAVQGNKHANVHTLEDVVVVGAGPMGIINAQVAHAYGARVIISDISPKKLERARSMGFADVIDGKDDPVKAVKQLTGGKGADTVICAVGSTVAYKQAYDMLKMFRGKMLMFASGYPKPELNLDPNEIHSRRIEIIGTLISNSSDYVDTAKMISSRMIDCKYALEGKTFPLRDIQAAYEAATTQDAYRISVDLQDV
ncbi:MAG: zinc-binding dehydrogenase [Lachnospiraceae bacterium]|jgi:L-iditol 2-dehydrogenase|nr:zinc-binding dehydrogenase [Lachnospiraceae bacterium]